ncbi:MAG: hypothetical protein JXA42_17285 [Anaerolineales bacterium]|nr:hypothetical protein [Anaerolineales bacterium]
MSSYHSKIKSDEQDGFVKRQESKKSVDNQIQPNKTDVNDMSPSGVLHLQRTIGNRAVGQLVSEHSDMQETPVQLELEEEELCPGSMIGSEGQGKGEGYGQGQGPMGIPKEEEGWV